MPAESSAAPSHFRPYATLGSRCGAFFIDAAIFIPIAALLAVPFAAAGVVTQQTQTLHAALVTCVAWIYFATMESSSRQATLGKQALHLEVTDLQGKRVTFAKATGRFFLKFLSSYPLPLVGFVLAAFTKRKQALHDLLSGCLVVRSTTTFEHPTDQSVRAASRRAESETEAEPQLRETHEASPSFPVRRLSSACCLRIRGCLTPWSTYPGSSGSGVVPHWEGV